MREYRKFLARFALYDKSGICKFLEKKAANGWLLVEMGVMFWKFKRIEPQKLKFSIVYFKNASEYDPKLTESQLRFQEYCEYGGWEFAASRGEILVYYSENENAVPIETDAVVEVKSVHSVMWRSWLLPYMLLTFSQGLRLYSYLGRFVQDPVTSLLTGCVTHIFINKKSQQYKGNVSSDNNAGYSFCFIFFIGKFVRYYYFTACNAFRYSCYILQAKNNHFFEKI